jgi:hypothetical protein
VFLIDRTGSADAELRNTATPIGLSLERCRDAGPSSNMWVTLFGGVWGRDGLRLERRVVRV